MRFVFFVQDAFQSLQNAPTTVWKNTIRVSFINQQGLAEAGIYQKGVFKECIQEVRRIAFDPAFNLFKVESFLSMLRFTKPVVVVFVWNR